MSLAPAPTMTDTRVLDGSSKSIPAILTQGRSLIPRELPILASQVVTEDLGTASGWTTADSEYFRGRLDPVSGVLTGIASIPFDRTPGEPAEALYSDLLDFVSDALPGGARLYRVWNYIPRINQEVDGLENYRSFNQGRWNAFEARFGADRMERELPAASAVGIDSEESGGALTVAFHAGSREVQYHENPLQTPAYHYPPDYGPKSPGFARGASVVNGLTYLSGTASIQGHQTVGENDLEIQCETTLANMSAVLDEMSIEAITPESVCELRVYLRKAESLPFVSDWLAHRLGMEIALEKTTYIRADICRESLDLEIEGIFI